MTTDYKTVFQLAQDKGYEKTSIIKEWSLQHPPVKTYTDEYQLLELTLIQKWLRDEHKIEVNATFILSATSLPQYCHQYGKQNGKWEFPRLSFFSYESALLEGINEALKLI